MRKTFTTESEAVSEHQELKIDTQQIAENKLIFYRLYDQYVSVILGIITRMVSDKAEAAVILEQSFITISQQIGRVKTGKQPMFVYLLGIARRTASDALAMRKQRRSASLQLTETGKVITPAWQMDSTILPEEISKNSADLSQRKFLHDVLFHNCTPEEAATSAGIPVTQARKQLRAAVQQLRNGSLRE